MLDLKIPLQECNFNRGNPGDLTVPTVGPRYHAIPGYMDYQGVNSKPAYYGAEKKWALGLQVKILAFLFFNVKFVSVAL